MSEMGLDSYDNTQKHGWRNWAWNRVVERLPEFIGRVSFNVKRMSNIDRRVLEAKTVLYLSGPDDFDRQVALRLGFRNENIIAVDTDPGNIAMVRRNGGIGIVGKLDEVIMAWRSDWPVDAVIADLCCGLSLESLMLIRSMLASIAVPQSAVVAVNLQRGRDAASNQFRSEVDAASPEGLEKHRGRAFAVAMISESGTPGAARNAECIQLSRSWLAEGMPVLNSYKSRSVRMDSVVMRMPLRHKVATDCLTEYGQTSLLIGRKPGRNVPKKLAALRAVRTMKSNRETIPVRNSL